MSKLKSSAMGKRKSEDKGHTFWQELEWQYFCMQIQSYIICLIWQETFYGYIVYNVKLRPLWSTPQRKVCYVDRKIYNW
jgi:hypothetical protein